MSGDSEGPNLVNPDGIRTSLRFALGLAVAGAGIAAYSVLKVGDEYLTITGGALVALGLGSAGLLKLLFDK